MIHGTINKTIAKRDKAIIKAERSILVMKKIIEKLKGAEK